MAIDDANSQPVADPASAYACKCLNVSCQPISPPASAPQAALQSDEFTPIFVAEDGIRIAHPQLTLRSRTHGETLASRSQSRYTTLSCLVCKSVIYRVNRAGTVDTEGRDGPVLPTDDWVEEEIMKSSTGWIEVHRDCIREPEITRLRSSPSYSALFSVLIPAVSTTPSPVLSEQSISSSKQSAQTSYLSHMRPILTPPPFTPSHPVFTHLASILTRRSEDIRKQAEKELEDVVTAKAKEIENMENDLRQHVQLLWKRYTESIHDVDQQQYPTKNPRHSFSSRRHSSGMNGSARHTSHGSLVVTDFVPQPASRSTNATSSSPPRVSTLSASLATSNFHHPKASHASATTSNTSIHEAMNDLRDDQLFTASNPRSSKQIPIAPDLASPGASVLKFPRTTDDITNTAASFAYFRLEEEMQKRQQEKDGKAKMRDSIPDSQDLESTSQRRKSESNSTTAGPSKAADTTSHTELDSRKSPTKEAPLSPRSKKDKRVKFDIQPDVVEIAPTVTAEKDEFPTPPSAVEMMFDLEDGGEENVEETPTKPILPLIERTQPRPTKSRTSSMDANEQGLSISYAALRPMSLPQFNMPAPRSSPPVVDTPPLAPISRSVDESIIEPPDEREAHLLKLVAADIPSHRGAWKRDTKAWETFVKRQDIRDSSASRNRQKRMSQQEDLDEEEEIPDDRTDEARPQSSHFIGSLPIAINPIHQRKEVLSLASYQPKTSLSDRPGTLVPPLLVGPKASSAASSRRAAYAQRDRLRSIDPGAHDFSMSGDYDEDESDESDSGEGLRQGDRGIRHARKILQARSSVPEAGMWMSLA